MNAMGMPCSVEATSTSIVPLIGGDGRAEGVNLARSKSQKIISSLASILCPLHCTVVDRCRRAPLSVLERRLGAKL